MAMMALVSLLNWLKAFKSTRDWLELPSDVMVNILKRIGVIEILENAQKVCTSWRNICKDPDMWRAINMSGLWNPYVNTKSELREMCKHVVDRSQGQLVHFTVSDFCNNELLLYVAERSSQLRHLEIASGFDDMHEGWTEALKKFPLLEELNLYNTTISKEAIETAGRYCQMLKILRINERELDLTENDEVAIAIGKNLPHLRHLELIRSNMSNTGLLAILDGCSQLELLDLRECIYIDLTEDIVKQCLRRIRYLKVPGDSIEGCPYINDTSDGEYTVWDYDDPTGFADLNEMFAGVFMDHSFR